MTVAAESTARVSGWGSYPAAASLFIVCGYDTYLYPSGTKSILQGTAPGSSPWNVDPTAIGLTYTIHASHVADCGLDSAGGGGEGGGGGKKEKDSKQGTETEGLERFKGLRDRDDTGYKAVPTTLLGDNGKKTGPTAQAVEAIDGCGVGEDPHNCVMIIPIAVSAVKSGSDNIFTIVRWLPFQVTSYKNGSVKHTGRLLGTDWVVRHQPTTNLVPWTVGSAIGPTSVRLVE